MYYLCYILILFSIINFYFRISNRFNIVDRPCERSSHTKPVIRGGGIIFPIGITCWFIWSGFQYPLFYTGLIIIGFISFLDDISTVKPWIRFLTHLVAILLLLVQVGCTPLPWWVVLFILIVATGIINAFNFMDGINGITAGYSLMALIGLWIVNNHQVLFVANEFIYAAGLAVLVFSFYNFRTQARCFAGDVGSVSIAFILVFLTGKLIIVSGNIHYLMFLCIYGVDAFLTIVYRLIRNENIFAAHRSHLYQVFANEAGISHVKVSTGYAVVQLMINFAVISLINHLNNFHMLLISIGIIFLLSTFYITIKQKISIRNF